MNLTIKPQIAIEAASIISDNKLELLGIYPLCEAYQPYSFAVKNKNITEDNTFCKIFTVDQNFFYLIQEFYNNKVIKYERGIGKYVKDGAKTILERVLPISHGGENVAEATCVNGCENFNCSDCHHLIVQSSFPTTYAECLYSDNVIISSSAPFFPHLIKIAPNSILARLQNNVESVSFEDLCSNKNFQNELISLLKKYSNQINLGCSKLSTKNISVNGIHINDNAEFVVKKNDIVCRDGKLKYYDGNKWYSIVMEEEK